MAKSLEDRAKEIAQKLYLEGVYPWQVGEKVEFLGDIALYEKTQLTELVKEKLKRIGKD